jgi:hypothetical protein
MRSAPGGRSALPALLAQLAPALPHWPRACILRASAQPQPGVLRTAQGIAQRDRAEARGAQALQEAAACVAEAEGALSHVTSRSCWRARRLLPRRRGQRPKRPLLTQHFAPHAASATAVSSAPATAPAPVAVLVVPSPLTASPAPALRRRRVATQAAGRTAQTAPRSARGTPCAASQPAPPHGARRGARFAGRTRPRAAQRCISRLRGFARTLRATVF